MTATGWSKVTDEDAAEVFVDVRDHVLGGAADELVRIADEVEARVTKHYGGAFGPGSADMIREAAKTVRAMTGKGAGAGAQPPAGEPTQPADFFQPDHTYQRGRWQFQCLAVAPAPWSDEVRAVGYLLRSDDEGSVWHLNAEDWARGDWTEATEGGEAR